MNHIKFKIKIGVILLLLTVVLHWAHYMIYRDAHHLFIYLVGDIAFVPLEVFLVSLAVDTSIEKREKAHIMENLNMLIGLFFSEIGTELMKDFVENDPNIDNMRYTYYLSKSLLEPDYSLILKETKKYKQTINVENEGFLKLNRFLISKKELLVTLMSSPSLLEHETFTDLLRAVLHLQEEFNYRHSELDLQDLDDSDLLHLKDDIERVYELLAEEWVHYMRQLYEEYSYLYYGAVIHNPYDFRDEKEIEREIFEYKWFMEHKDNYKDIEFNFYK
jgi:hypothetical protein